jgi:hypothetical protein
VFSALDPISGRGRELAKFATDPLGFYHWDLSPDGKRIAILKAGENQIYVLPLSTGVVRDHIVKGWTGFNSLDWSSDGKGFFIGSLSGGSATLIYVDQAANADPLWHQKSTTGTWGVPPAMADSWRFSVKNSTRTSGRLAQQRRHGQPHIGGTGVASLLSSTQGDVPRIRGSEPHLCQKSVQVLISKYCQINLPGPSKWL